MFPQFPDSDYLTWKRNQMVSFSRLLLERGEQVQRRCHLADVKSGAGMAQIGRAEGSSTIKILLMQQPSDSQETSVG